MKHLFLSLLITGFGSAAAGQDAFVGRALYARYCATCHGVDATGNGPMAPVLLVQPKDLTQLQSETGGEFFISGIIAKIDGRDPLVSHGSEMPVYGEFFEGRGVTIRGEEGILIMTTEPIVDLIAYLQSIQRAP